MSNHRPSLAEQLADLDEPAPKDIDPEDQEREPFEAETDDAAREHYLDVGPSSLRRLADSIADPKYDGVKTSRKQLMDEDDVSAASDHGEPEEDASDDDTSRREEATTRQSALSASEEDEEDEEERRPSECPAPRQRKSRDDEGADASDADDLSAALRQKRDEDRRKGKAVSRQLTLWDALLDARIRIQKSVSAANRLPSPQDLPGFMADDACRNAQHALLDEALALSGELALLRDGLMRAQGVSVPERPRKKRRLDGDPEEGAEGDVGVYAEDVKEESDWASTLEHAHHAHLTHTLAKWSAKVAAVAPSTLAAKNAFAQRNRVTAVPAQVADALAIDSAKLVARTRVRRTPRARVRLHGTRENAADEGGDGGDGDPETFDDTDFYQQLLRDVIDARGADGGGGGSGQADWVLTQRQRKARKKVDTKASKGRKLRYEVHERLQNFMVPVPLAGGWHEAQIDELFASLLGKGFEHAQPTPEEEQSVPVEISGEMLKGLRVFG
ncbi:apoptosis-antagonizing transcription factor [Vararia minispora EC-137]|uniref:Apoptosis-antagonizing transcription factor n=1 Tax=Vararia minispora EC-137 TaxID=1314806 RepID=A0ACB8QPK0_9AGAM|nr:apoptosis-antagonizing transcription factor [Vararia minispora EC-137]